jgi:hypothetical protein
MLNSFLTFEYEKSPRCISHQRLLKRSFNFKFHEVQPLYMAAIWLWSAALDVEILNSDHL